MITLHFHQQPHYNMNFIYMSHSNLSSSCFWFNMAEAEQAPCLPPVLVEIPARVQAVNNPLPRAPEAGIVQADQAAPAN